MLAHMPSFHRCYERQLRLEPRLTGRVTLQLEIDASGAVSSARAIDDSMGSPAVASCIESAAAAMRFPAPPGGARSFSFPLLFDPGR
jgi:TonB family protein